MRKIYLIRHAMPAIPLGERWCIGGRTDIPLGPVGLLQAALLPFIPQLQTVSAVFCSPLLRARQTAMALSRDAQSISGLEEQDMGVWDGLSFTEIRNRFPILYEARERNPSLLPEGAESAETVSFRMQQALYSCLEKSVGDIAVISHKSAISSLIGHRSEINYTSISTLKVSGSFLPAEIGLLPHPQLTDSVCLALLHAIMTPPDRLAHCLAVAKEAARIGNALMTAGFPLNLEQIHSAALLHDLARQENNHAQTGALWLRALGYPDISELVRQHHDLDSEDLNEAAVLYIADKLVLGAKPVGIEERFSRSLTKCRSKEALDSHARRLTAARHIKELINAFCCEKMIQ